MSLPRAVQPAVGCAGLAFTTVTLMVAFNSIAVPNAVRARSHLYPALYLMALVATSAAFALSASIEAWRMKRYALASLVAVQPIGLYFTILTALEFLVPDFRLSRAVALTLAPIISTVTAAHIAMQLAARASGTQLPARSSRARTTAG